MVFIFFLRLGMWGGIMGGSRGDGIGGDGIRGVWFIGEEMEDVWYMDGVEAGMMGGMVRSGDEEVWYGVLSVKESEEGE